MGWLRKYVSTPPGVEVGRLLQFKPMSAVVATARVLEVHEKFCIIEITWTATGIYKVGKDYEVKHGDPDWYVVRESA